VTTAHPPDPPPAGEPPVAERRGFFFWVGLVVGWGLIVFALHGLLTEHGTNPPALFRLLIGLNVVNDALVVPLLVVLALVVRRVVPRFAIVAVDVGLIASAVVLLYAYPLLGDWTRTTRAGDSRLPWDYAHNVAVVLAAIWFVCALLALLSWRRGRSNAR